MNNMFPVSPIICSVFLRLAARSVLNSPSLAPSPGVLGLSPHVAAEFGCVQRGRPSSTEGAEDRCGLHNGQQISRLSDLNPSSIPPYISPRLPCPDALQALLCRGNPESLRHIAPSHHWLGANQFTAPLEGDYQHLSVKGNQAAQGSTYNGQM